MDSFLNEKSSSDPQPHRGFTPVSTLEKTLFRFSAEFPRRLCLSVCQPPRALSVCLPASPSVCRKAMPTCFAFGKRGGVIAKVSEVADARLSMSVRDTSTS